MTRRIFYYAAIIRFGWYIVAYNTYIHEPPRLPKSCDHHHHHPNQDGISRFFVHLLHGGWFGRFCWWVFFGGSKYRKYLEASFGGCFPPLNWPRSPKWDCECNFYIWRWQNITVDALEIKDVYWTQFCYWFWCYMYRSNTYCDFQSWWKCCLNGRSYTHRGEKRPRRTDAEGWP